MFYNFFYEIQTRGLLVIVAWSFAFITSYYYKEIMLFTIVQPYLNFFKKSSCYFIFTDLTEVFSTYMSLCSFITNQLTIFLIAYHILLFLVPGLYKFESQYFKNLLVFNFFGWLGVLVVLRKVLLPASYHFFLAFQTCVSTRSLNFYFEAKINEYLNFYITLYFFLFFIVQFFILASLCIIRYTKILQEIKTLRKIFYFVFCMLATIITPPDIISQLIVCLSLIVGYETINFIGIIYMNIKILKKFCIYNSNG